MEGRARAAERQFDLAISQAWHGEALAREKRLGPLKKYLAAAKPQRPQGPAAMLDAFRSLKAGGAPITIKRLM